MEINNIEVKYKEVKPKKHEDDQLKLISNNEMVKFIVSLIEINMGIKFDNFIVESRARIVAVPRQLCMVLIRKNTRYSVELIGEYLGGRDHSTVTHAVKTISDLVDTDKQFKILFDELNYKIDNFVKPTTASRLDVFMDLLAIYVTGDKEIENWIKKYTNTI